jgi:hypothetical protein
MVIDRVHAAGVLRPPYGPKLNLFGASGRVPHVCTGKPGHYMG